MTEIIEFDKKYADLIVFEDQPKRRLKTVEETVYSSEKPCDRSGECIPSCSYYDPYCGCILGRRYR